MLNIDINVIVSCGKQVFSVGSVALVCDKDYSFKAGGKCLKKTTPKLLLVVNHMIRFLRMKVTIQVKLLGL